MVGGREGNRDPQYSDLGAFFHTSELTSRLVDQICLRRQGKRYGRDGFAASELNYQLYYAVH